MSICALRVSGIKETVIAAVKANLLPQEDIDQIIFALKVSPTKTTPCQPFSANEDLP
jgi:hypothetical protein